MSQDNKSSSSNRLDGPRPFGSRTMLPVEKPKEFKKTIKRLAGYLRPRRQQLFLIAVAAFFATLFNVVSPKILGDATSAIFEGFTQGTGVDFDYLTSLAMLLMGLYAASALFSFLQQYVMASVAQTTAAELRQEVNEKLSRLPLSYLDQKSHGDLLSRAVNDIDSISTSLQQGLAQIITSAISVVGIIIMMLIISPLLTLVVLVTVPMSILVIRYVATFSQKHFRNQQRELGVINSHIEEMLSGHQVVKAFSHEKRAVEQFDEINKRLYLAGWKAQFISGIMMPLMFFITNLGYVMVSIVGGILVLQGQVRLGDVQAFIQYAQQISHPMSQMASIANMVQSALASAERIFALLDEREENTEAPAATDTSTLAGKVSFEQVSFAYQQGVPVIKNLNVQVEEGQTVAIVGPTGAGKTTLINLLLRFYQVDKGSIKVGGVDINHLSREQVRSMFAMVLQDTWLFKGTIAENIAYGSPEATQEQIVAAAKRAYADDFVRTLPQGYQTELGEDATNISQGQRQLLTIARAILAQPKILLLDEATSSVDTRTEMKIQRAMGQLMEGRTSFVIAHRLSTIRDADVILVMHQGDIVEQGSHQQLLEQDGFYARLYNSQFSS